jgi:hypothetical protein
LQAWTDGLTGLRDGGRLNPGRRVFH